MSPILTIYPAFKYREKEERYYLSLKDIVHCDSGWRQMKGNDGRWMQMKENKCIGRIMKVDEVRLSQMNYFKGKWGLR